MKWQVMVEDIASIRHEMVEGLLDFTSWSMARHRVGPHTGMLALFTMIQFSNVMCISLSFSPLYCSDIFVPKGCLYFSIPIFGNSISQLSSKEGPLTVRQIGWHTGWRREESQMVGTFRVVPIEKAQRVDGF
jgi:hypothetical protein